MIEVKQFGSLENGQKVEQYCLINKNGVQVDILSYAGIVRRWLVPANSSAKPIDIVLGLDSLEEYLADESSFGALVGRYANRIAKGKFWLDGKEQQVDINQGGNCLHGGSDGFNKRLWQCSILSESENPSIALELSSPDGDQGFPGKLDVKVIYTLTEENSLKIEYFAASNKTTVFNPTNHAYFNLNGHGAGSVKDHLIQLQAEHYTPVYEGGIPTGQLTEVGSTPFDIKVLTPVNNLLDSHHQQIEFSNGIDHNWCLDNFDTRQKEAQRVGLAKGDTSGIEMTIFTSMPGMQIYTANHFDNMQAKESAMYQAHQGICFESQFYPDSPNNMHFPSAELKAGDTFYSITEYKLSF